MEITSEISASVRQPVAGTFSRAGIPVSRTLPGSGLVMKVLQKKVSRAHEDNAIQG